MKDKIFVAVDFDGTCIKTDRVAWGADVPGAVYYIKKLILHGAEIMLYTCRDGRNLTAAKEWFARNDIFLDSVNETSSYFEGRFNKNGSKPFANYYIDDKAVGAFLIEDTSGEPYIDWAKVYEFIAKKEGWSD